MRLDLNGINYHTYQHGHQQRNVVFLHYFGGSGRTWDTVMHQLADTFCVAPDLRGFGDTEAHAVDYSLDAYADDVDALVHAFHLRHVILVGHSMGGKIALNIAARKPQWLQSLLLVAPSPPTPEPMTDDDRDHLLASHGDHTAARTTVLKITAIELPPQSFEHAVEDNVRSSRAAWRAWLQYGSREDISDRMSQIVVPVTLLSGANDPIISPALLEQEVLARLTGTNISMQVLPNVGHLVPLEAPQAIAATLREMIS